MTGTATIIRGNALQARSAMTAATLDQLEAIVTRARMFPPRSVGTCGECGIDFYRRTSELVAHPDHYCSWECWRTKRNRRRGIPTEFQTSRVEDVEELLAWRESPEQIVLRLHTTAGALARALYRAGRRDLAAPFCRIAERQRRAREARHA